jgi:hypothetical protein
MRASVTHEGRVGKDQKRFNLKGVSPNASPDLYAGFDHGSQARSSLLEDRESNPRDNSEIREKLEVRFAFLPPIRYHR